MSTHPHISFTSFAEKRVHLGVSGSIAAYKALELTRLFAASQANVGATLTKAASAFVTSLAFKALGASPVFQNIFDPQADSVHDHLYPGHEADAFVITPATANTLAKLAHGLADDMLSCQALSYTKPLVIAPAMNPNLWNNPATQANWDILRTRGHVLIEPEIGDMACGDQGKGRLANLEEIYLQGLKAMTTQDLAGTSVLITLGPTREPWDGVRFWSNPSSGIMGGALTVAAWLRGASVHAVTGPVSLWLPADIRRYKVNTALEMYDACLELWPSMDVGCFCAAVADFSPVPFGKEKFKKASVESHTSEASGLNISFTPNPDILKKIGQNKNTEQKLIGFAAETSDLAENASRKLRSKNADIIVANNVGLEHGGFGAADNEVVLVRADGNHESWPLMSKTDVAWRVWDCLLRA